MATSRRLLGNAQEHKSIIAADRQDYEATPINDPTRDQGSRSEGYIMSIPKRGELTPTRAEIAKLMADGRARTVQDAANGTGQSPENARHHIYRLVKLGLLVREKVNGMHVYQKAEGV